MQTWQTVATVWAKVESLSGRELFQAQQVNADTTTRVTLRYYPGLSAKDRFLLNGVNGARALNIEGVSDPDERHRYLVCMCHEAMQ